MYGQHRILDAHIHFQAGIDPKQLIDIMDATGTDRANLVLVPHRQRISSVPEALMVKDLYPERFFVFTGFDVSEYYRHKKSLGKHQAAYVKRMMKCGCDGLKIIEGKPQMRKMLPVPDFDLPCWEPFWAYAEEAQLPILWHVNDPETFWDPEKIPAFAKEKGWFYDETFINNEEQYRQILAVLEKHPKLKIIFAHFFFLSAQLQRLSKLLDTYENLRIDITPGIELFINLSENIEEARTFFTKYQDRVIYGTDIGARAVILKDDGSAQVGKPSKQATAPSGQTSTRSGSVVIDKVESKRRAEIVQAFLCQQEPVRVQADGNFLIGTEDFTLKALDLGDEITGKVLEKNFLSFVAKEGDDTADPKPAAVVPALVRKECRRLKGVLKFMSLFDPIADKHPDFAEVEEYFSKF